MNSVDLYVAWIEETLLALGVPADELQFLTHSVVPTIMAEAVGYNRFATASEESTLRN